MRTLLFLTASFVLSLGIAAAYAPYAYAQEAYLTGIVTDSGGPVPSVLVVLQQGGDQKGRSLTGDDGGYYIGNLQPGEYQVVVRRGEEVLFRAWVRLPEQREYDIRLGL